MPSQGRKHVVPYGFNNAKTGPLDGVYSSQRSIVWEGKEVRNPSLAEVAVISLLYDQVHGDTNAIHNNWNHNNGHVNDAFEDDDSQTRNNQINNATQCKFEKELEKQLEEQEPSDFKDERTCNILMQIAVPFFIAGLGSIAAGIALDTVERWEVFKAIPSLITLVPALIGLKGNLDMCLASRICTQVNISNLSRREMLRLIYGNITLVQVQAITAASIVSVTAVLFTAIDSRVEVFHVLLVVPCAIFTATTSCFVLDTVMVLAILLMSKLHVNPDYFATPLAASIGDFISISTLAAVASFMYQFRDSCWVYIVIMIIYLSVLLPFWIFLVLRNEYVREALKVGWTPVLSALFISMFGGLVLQNATRYDSFARFSPIVNGVGGNLVSVQANRLSTLFHQTAIMGELPLGTKMWINPARALFGHVTSAKTARILMGLSVPGHLVFVFTADLLSQHRLTIQADFLFMYIVVSLIQLTFLLYTAHVLIHYMWLKKRDPDNCSIPYLTALGDLSGSALLFAGYFILYGSGGSSDQ